MRGVRQAFRPNGEPCRFSTERNLPSHSDVSRAVAVLSSVRTERHTPSIRPRPMRCLRVYRFSFYFQGSQVLSAQ
jgi:hypothetical protein